jgi:hypothetical protein
MQEGMEFYQEQRWGYEGLSLMLSPCTMGIWAANLSRLGTYITSARVIRSLRPNRERSFLSQFSCTSISIQMYFLLNLILLFAHFKFTSQFNFTSFSIQFYILLNSFLLPSLRTCITSTIFSHHCG